METIALRSLWLALAIILSSIPALAQKINGAFELSINRTSQPPVIDGIADDAAWAVAAAADDFRMVLPMDTSRARVRTTVKMSYDATNIYVLAVCYTLPNQSYMVESLRRDFVFGKNDNFIFFIDPFNDLTNGFTFGANAAGAQWDGTLYEGGKADLNWDNKWISVVKNYPDRWIFEAAIPFKTIRYKKGIQTWGINFSRLDITAAEKSAWAPVPRQFPTAALAYTGNLRWDQPLPDPGLNISLIPFALAAVTKNYEQPVKAAFRKDIGTDAKLALTSSLNLDLTVNPDYSQVEVDRQVTNLDRFELFFPERRQFFLENNDLFANFGFTTIRPFFSRRIGLGVPISFGARISGSLSRDWRIGVLDMQTKQQRSTGLPAHHFTAIALQKRIFTRSNIRLLLVNKQALHYQQVPDSLKQRYSRFNRNIGIEYNLASANNIWNGKLMFLKSLSPGKATGGLSHAANLQYAARHLTLGWQHEYVGENYTAEVGYVPRSNYIRLAPNAAYLFFPPKGKVLSHGPRYTGSMFLKPGSGITDYENILLYIFNRRDQSIFDVWVANSFVELLQPFDPTNNNKDSIAAGTRHHWRAFGIEFFSRPQQLFTYSITTRAGGYYAGGERYNITAELGYRIQPYAGITLSTSYNRLALPAPWGNTDFWLIGPRIDLTFTNRLFFTTFIQYNNQQKNININTRFQWRYRPASDLFLVYTDNYYADPFFIRNRAFVLKATYWWNN